MYGKSLDSPVNNREAMSGSTVHLEKFKEELGFFRSFLQEISDLNETFK
jgi:hypothetical protein